MITEESACLHDLGGFVIGVSSYCLCLPCQIGQAKCQRENDSKSLMTGPKQDRCGTAGLLPEARPEGGGQAWTNASWLGSA